MERILIIRNFGHIGDLLMLTPTLKELSKKFKIDLLILSKYKKVFLNLNFINNIFTKNEDIKDIGYDKKIDLSDYEFNYEQIYQPQIQKNKQKTTLKAKTKLFLNTILKIFIN